MNRIYLLCILFLLISSTGIAQRNYSAEAEKAFSDYQFKIAVRKYEKAYHKVKKNKIEQQRIQFRIGECYRNMSLHKKAAAQFAQLVKINYQRMEPLTLLYYADALRTNQNYSGALEQYEAYLLLRPDDIRGVYGVKSCEMASNWLKNPTRHLVTNEKRINTSKDDWAPAFANNQYSSLIFSSNRPGTKGSLIDKWKGETFTDIFVTKKRPKGDWEAPKLLEKENIINTQANEGPGVFDSRFNTLYFTRCGYDKKKEMNCQIYFSELNNNRWSSPQVIILASPEYNVIQPSISSDELTIYFVTDMPGGNGDLDIWSASRKNKSLPFDRAENLGPMVNTPGKEEFPVIYHDSILFFSSNTHPGLGGYDIFKSVHRNGEWSKPENMGSPVNSSADDFEFIIHPDQVRGYFSSNRSGGIGGDDIYTYFLRPLAFNIRGSIKDMKTNSPLTDVIIKLKGSDGTTAEVKSDKSGRFTFDSTQIRPEFNYELSNEVQDYYSTKKNLSTIGFEKNKTFEIEFNLIPTEKQSVILPEIRFEFGKWEIPVQYQDSLVSLVSMLKEHKNIMVEISAYTDSRDNDDVNDELSQKRAEAVVTLLVTQGIEKSRLVATGYGKRLPRQLEKDFVVNSSIFRKGTILNDAFINTLSDEEKEDAHQLNSRTAVRVLRDDYDKVSAYRGIINSKSETKPVFTTKAFTDNSENVESETKVLVNSESISKPSPEIKKETEPIKKVVPVVKNEEPVIEIEAPIIKKEDKLDEKEIAVLKKESTIVKKEVPIERKEESTNKKATPVNEQEEPVVKKVIPVLTKEEQVIEKEAPPVKIEEVKSIFPPNCKFTVQVGTKKITPELKANFKDLRACTGPDNIVRVVTGVFDTYEEATEFCKQARKYVPGAFVAPVDEKRNNCR